MMQQVADVSVLGLSGELDPHEGRLLLRKIGRLIRREWGKIVLDLREVEHIHFGVLSDLSLMATASSFSAGGIKLANLRPYTREILRAAGVDRCFETYDSVAEAILSFQGAYGPPCEMQ